ncbi:MAG: hypothetical protein RLZZ562_1497 [Planctomycetota bacterium]
MNRPLLPVLFLATVVAGALKAHFPFLVPAADGATAVLVMSETLEADPDVSVSLLADAKLFVRDAAGVDRPLAAPPADVEQESFSVALPGSGTRVLHGTVDLGVHERKAGPAHRLVYHVKSVVGDPLEESARRSTSAPVEFVAEVGHHCYHLRLLVDGAPAARRPMHLLLPDGSDLEIETDANGRTPPLMPGRIGAWARDWKSESGEAGGRTFTQVRRYATFVADLPDPHASKPIGAAMDRRAVTAVRAAGSLPRPVASFGAVAHDGWLYVYGGHTGDRHDYSTATVSDRFERVRLDDLVRGQPQWETLPAGPRAQGLDLAVHAGRVLRAGGMQPRNEDGEEADNHSLDEAAFLAAVNREQWRELPRLPVARSSHGVAVVGDALLLLGGWTMQGAARRGDFPSTTLVLDLASPTLAWRELPQPFRRRALAAVANGERVFAVGGFDENDKPSLDVDVLHVPTSTWTKAPQLPGDARNGFGPAAAMVDGRVYVGVASGEILRLAEDERSWEIFARSTPRIVHRMVAHGSLLVILGGACGAEMTDCVEVVETRREAVGGCPQERMEGSGL